MGGRSLPVDYSGISGGLIRRCPSYHRPQVHARRYGAARSRDHTPHQHVHMRRGIVVNVELLPRARKVIPMPTANAKRTEYELRPIVGSIAVVRWAGLCALTVPSEAGGHEADLRMPMSVVAELGTEGTHSVYRSTRPDTQELRPDSARRSTRTRTRVSPPETPHTCVCHEVRRGESLGNSSLLTVVT
jgi:hypothetical protein